ncbi:MAG: hypothetical protein FJ303_23470 [Planctomycetes bacterium]|nr:hypothetical protein [Planctomycetota bacterium]
MGFSVVGQDFQPDSSSKDVRLESLTCTLSIYAFREKCPQKLEIWRRTQSIGVKRIAFTDVESWKNISRTIDTSPIRFVYFSMRRIVDAPKKSLATAAFFIVL